MATDATPESPLKKPIGRRDFVKTTVKVAGGTALAAIAVPSVVPLSYNPRKIPRFPYVGARILPPGPAPQGIPLIPVKVNDNGEIEGIPENKRSKVKHSLEWYKYCSHEAAPGLALAFTSDNVLRYNANPEKLEQAVKQGFDVWYEHHLNEAVRAEHFKKVGDGAPFRWRSEGQEGTNIITGIIIKVNPANVANVPEGFVHDNKDGTGFLAVCSFCAHFCCVPGYLENNNPLAKVGGKGINDTVIFCSCHDSRYDFMDIRQYTFPPDF